MEHLVELDLSTLVPRLSAEEWQALACGGTRLAALSATVPVFVGRVLPLRWRVAAGVVLLWVLASGRLAAVGAAGGLGAAPALPGVIPRDPLGAALVLAGEAAVGLCLGGLVLAGFAAARGAATLISDQIGFSLAGPVDSLGEETWHPLAELHEGFAVFVFLATGLHHAVLRAVAASFELIPPGAVPSSGASTAIAKLALVGGSCAIEMALALALPVLGLLLIVSVVQGILGRIVPETEFLVLGLPLRFAAAVGAAAVLLPGLAARMQHVFQGSLAGGRDLLAGLAG